MKQTNNAIKFLLAQYRAIFKHAYLKGLASAVIMTAGLAAGAANAADANFLIDNTFSGTFTSDSSSITITGNTSDKGTDNKYQQISSTDFKENATSLKGTLTIQSGAATDNSLEASTANFTLSGSGFKLVISGTSTTDGLTLTTKNSSAVTSTVDIGEINISKGVLALGVHSTTASGNLSVSAQDITVGTATGSAGDASITLATLSSYTGAASAAGDITLGKFTNTKGDISGSTITLNKSGKIFFGGSGAALTAGTETILDGKTLNAQGGLLDFTSGSGIIKVTSAFENPTYTEGNEPGTQLNIDVAAGKTASIQLNSYTDANSKIHRGILYFGSESKIDLKQADSTSGGILEITSGSASAGSIVEIQAGANLTSTAATSPQSVGIIKVKGVAGTTPKASDFSELRIDAGVLSSFLLSDGSTPKDAAGAVELGANSILDLTNGENTLTVELGGVEKTSFDSKENQLDLVLDSGAASDTGGKVFVSGASTLQAESIKISSAVKSTNTLSDLTVTADTVTLGSTDFQSSSISDNSNGLKGLKIKATANQTVDLVAGDKDNGAYTLVSGSIIRTGSYYKQDATTGINDHSQINTAAELVDDKDNLVLGSSGTLEVQGGNWQTSKDITISGGAFTVTSDKSSGTFSGISTAKDNGNYSLVTLNGNLNLTAGDLKVTGKSGANAVLDITGATVPLNGSQAATITLAGASSYIANIDDATAVLDEKAGYGVLKVDGSKFLTNFENSKAKILLGDDGVLYVTNPDTGTYNFDTFQSGAAAAAGKVVFSGAGFVVVDGDLHLTTGKGVQGEAGATVGSNLNIGQGTIVVDNLTLENDYKVKKDESTTAYDSVIIESGTLVIHEGLDSANTSTEFLLGSGSKGANLTFTTDAGKSGSVGVDLTTNVDDTSSGSITFDGGDWTVQNIDLAHGEAGDKLTIAASETATSVTGNNLKAGASDEVTVNAQGSATFTTAQLTSAAKINVNGDLTLTGKKEIAEDDVAYNQGLAGVNLSGSTFTVDNGGVLTLGDAILAAEDQNTSGSISFKTENEKTTATINSALDASYTVHQGGELVLDFSETTAKSIFDETGVNAAKAAALKDALFDNDADTKLKGILNLGNAELDIQYGADLNGWHTVTWDNISEFAQITGGDVTTEKLKNTIVTEVKQGTNLSGQYAAIMVDSSHNTGASVNTDNDFGLHNAYEVNGQKYYIFKQETGGKISVLGLNSTAGDVTLAGGGLIGETKVAETLSIIGEGTTYVQGNLTTAGLNVSGELKVSGDTTVSDHANISSNAAFTTKNLTAKDSDVVVMGNATATDKLTLNGTSVLDVIGGTLSVKDATLATGSELNVGYEKLSTVTKDDPETIFDDTQSYGGNLEITGQLILNGGVLRLDPSYDRPAAFGAVNNLSDHVAVSINTPDLKAGNLDGNVYVGQNSVLGIGVSSLDEVKTATANFMNGEALDKNDVGAVLYLNKQFNIDADYGLTLTADSVENFAKYYNDNKKTSTLSLNSNTNPTISDTVFLGANTAILVSSEVAAQADTVQNGDKAVAIIGFNSTQGNVVADGGELILAGNVRVSTYKVFDNAKIQYIDGTEYKVVEDSKAEHYEDNINISTENGVLVGVVGTDGTTSLTLAKDARAKLAGASDPVYTTLVAYANGYNGDDPNNADAKLYYVDDEGTNNTAYNNDVLQYSISTGNGATAEQVSRLGVYAGAAQAAISAGASTYEAVSGRMGVGAQNGSVVFADNGQGAGLWVTPIYKNHDSDGFDAQGLSYGADMDMYGVALGGDFTMANGLRVGAAFNVGSGDADGQGAGAGVSNDFDYYGFSVYGGYTLDKLSIVGDISYTVVDNDAEANTALGKATTSLDTSNLSVGVTGQYTFNLNAVDVTPHAGLRYTYIDMDDYTVKVDGSEQARYAADSMSIFSIPVGVTFSKDISSGDWTIKPTFDLTLTANVGDDSMDGSVTWAGVDNLTTNLESEVIDNFTYGATLGVAAKTGNFSFGLGVNYTGASSADEYGVSANARFVF